MPDALGEDAVDVAGEAETTPLADDETMLPVSSTSGTAANFVLMPKTALKAGEKYSNYISSHQVTRILAVSLTASF